MHYINEALWIHSWLFIALWFVLLQRSVITISFIILFDFSIHIWHLTAHSSLIDYLIVSSLSDIIVSQFKLKFSLRRQ